MCPVACFGQTDVSAPCLNQQMGRNEMSSLVGQKNLQELLVFLHSVSHGCLCQLESYSCSKAFGMRAGYNLE